MYNRMYLEIRGQLVFTKFMYSDKYVKVLKKIHNARYVGNVDKFSEWSIPLTELQKLCREMRIEKYYLSLSEEIQKMFNVDSRGFSKKEIEKREKWRLSHISNAIDCKDFDEDSLEMPYPLLNYQRGGIYYAELKKGRILLGDDMGLGKTIQGIGIAKRYRTDWPVVVVAPASLILNWKSEILKWLPKDVTEDDVFVMKNGKSKPKGKIIVCSYDYSYKNKEILTQFLGVKGILLVDEAHNIKNLKAKRTEGIIYLSHFSKRVVLMTGTPMLNRVEELFPLLHAIDPIRWDDYISFVFRYCDAKRTKFGLDVGGISNDEELHCRLRDELMCRRLKKDVLKQLPDKRRTTLILDTSKAEINKTKEIIKTEVEKIVYSIKKNNYDLNSAKSFLLSKGSSQIGDTLFEAYKLTGMSKIESLCSWVQEKIESGLEKIIIFGHHKEFLDKLQEQIDNINIKRQNLNKKTKDVESHKKEIGYMRIDGSTSKEKRFENQSEFQENENCNVALLSINAANSGLTLTSSNVVVMGELPWTPGVSRQAEDRVHRIGQKNNVDIYYTIAEETFDGALWNMLRNKSLIASNVLDAGEGDKMEENMDENIQMGSSDLLTALIIDTYKRMENNEYDVDEIVKRLEKQMEE